MKRNRSLVLGITGGIGSGKSTVAQFFREKGVPVIDADRISRELFLIRGTDLVLKLKASFGDSIIDGCGRLDRKALAEIVFKDKNALERLNTIMHPLILEDLEEKLEESKKTMPQLIVLDVPLPIKKGFLDKCHSVWVVVADREARIERLIASRGYSREECEARMNAQPCDDEYIEVADVVIDNSSSIDDLRIKLGENLKTLLGE